MPVTNTIPIGAPCWSDVGSFDLDSTAQFYGDLFGWNVVEAGKETGGYHYFFRNGEPIAGIVPIAPELERFAVWTVYFAVRSVHETVSRVVKAGGSMLYGPMSAAALGTLMAVQDSVGSNITLWEHGVHPGYGVVDEPGTPCGHELRTSDHRRAVAFYEEVFGWQRKGSRFSDGDLMTCGGVPVARIVDARDVLPAGDPGHWLSCIGTRSLEAAADKVTRCGGSVGEMHKEGRWRRLDVSDPAGASLCLVELVH